MACADCEEAVTLQGADRPHLLPWRGTRVSVLACSRHAREIAQAFDLLNAFYDASYQEAVTQLTSDLLALHNRTAAVETD